MVEGFPNFLPYLVGFIVAENNRERLRIGDNVAHTRVVKVRSNAEPASPPP